MDSTLPGRALASTLAVLVLLVGGALAIVVLLRSPELQRRGLARLGRVHHRLGDRVDGWAASLRSLREHPPRLRDIGRIVGWSA